MREVTVIKEATAYKELYILVSIHSCSLHSITHATQLLSSLNYSCYSVALFTRLLMLRSCSLYSINHTTQLLSSLNYSCYSVALFTRLLMLLSCSLYPITQTSPTVFFSRNHIILPIGVASSSGRYFKFSSVSAENLLVPLPARPSESVPPMQYYHDETVRYSPWEVLVNYLSSYTPNLCLKFPIT